MVFAMECVALGLGGCSGNLGVARDRTLTNFSAAFQCPTDRVTVQAPLPSVSRPPPPDVAADPARLAIWNQETSDNRANTVFSRALGCGHAVDYTCGWQSDETYDCVGQEEGKVGMNFNNGTLIIAAVKPGSVADKAGFRVGDKILSVDQKPIQLRNGRERRDEDWHGPSRCPRAARRRSGGLHVHVSAMRLP